MRGQVHGVAGRCRRPAGAFLGGAPHTGRSTLDRPHAHQHPHTHVPSRQPVTTVLHASTPERLAMVRYEAYVHARLSTPSALATPPIGFANPTHGSMHAARCMCAPCSPPLTPHASVQVGVERSAGRADDCGWVNTSRQKDVCVTCNFIVPFFPMKCEDSHAYVPGSTCRSVNPTLTQLGKSSRTTA